MVLYCTEKLREASEPLMWMLDALDYKSASTL